MRSDGNKLKKRQDIQVLRGIAVSGVFLFHLLPDHFPSGYLGVDVFFVISGFLLTPSIEKIFSARGEKRKTLLKSFYLRRFFRLTPPRVVVVISFSLWMFVFGPLGEQRYAFIQGLTALLNIANFQAFRLSQGNYFHPDPNALLHTWSLSAEEQVFIILPLILIALNKFFHCSFRRSLLISFLLGIVFYLVVNFTDVISQLPLNLGNRDFFYFSPLFRVSEFLIGSLLAIYRHKMSLPKHLRTILFANLCLIMIIPTQNKLLLLLALGTTAALVVNPKEQHKPNGLNFVGTKIGDASYSIYLVHLPVIYISNQMFVSFEQRYLLVIIVSVLMTALLGGLSYYFIEGKIKQLLIETSGKHRIAVIACIFLVPVFVMGILRLGSINYYGLASPPTLVGTISCEKGENIGYCGDAEPGARQNYLLVGDSHAAALSEIFQREVSALGGDAFVMYGRGCPLSLDGFNTKRRVLTPCQNYLKMVLEFAIKNESTLVIAQRSSQETWPDQSSTQDLIASINFLDRHAKKTFVILPNPEFRKGQSQGSLSSLFESNSNVPRSLMLPASFADSTLLRKGLDQTRISLFDSSQLFCSERMCSFKRNGKYLYWDSNHLSRDGAEQYSDFFSSLVLDR